jgi:hypothetical protein
MAIQQISINQITNPADRQKLLDVLKECSASKTRIEAERDLIKEAVTNISGELKLPKKIINRMVKVYHKQNFDEEVAVQEQFETLYQNIVK